MTRQWRWRTDTAPFSAQGRPDQPALFVVEQISDKDFRIAGDGFQYNPDDGPPVVVTGDTLPATDFASIPRYMAWLVSRHGRHTPAALVHDQLVVKDMAFADRKRADARFLRMLDDLEVPPVLGRVMYSAVTLATRRTDRRARLGFHVWAGCAAAGLGLLVYGLVNGEPRLVAVALVAPFAAAALWGDQYWAGLVAGLALPVVALPAVASLAGYLAYWLVERGVLAGRKQLAPNRSKELPSPSSYQGR